jgi:hypothetical protein
MRIILLAMLAMMLFTNQPKADQCKDYSWIPDTPTCIWFGAKTRLDIMARGVERGFRMSNMPAYYQMVIVHSGRNGAASDSYVSSNPPFGMQRGLFVNFYVYVTLEYLAERDDYATLFRAGMQRYCESHHLIFPTPLSGEAILEQCGKTERCVYDNMRRYQEGYYFTALLDEQDLQPQPRYMVAAHFLDP